MTGPFKPVFAHLSSRQQVTDKIIMELNVTVPFGHEAHHFHAVDYVIFIALLCVSISIGFFYACSGGKQRTATEYLVGNRNMGKLPIAMSLTASFMSSIAMLGMPSEIYTYGIGYFYVIIGLILAITAAAYLFLPVFYRLRVTSVNEYIEKRFDKPVRFIASSLFIVTMNREDKPLITRQIENGPYTDQIYRPNACNLASGPYTDKVTVSLDPTQTKVDPASLDVCPGPVTGINIWWSILTIGIVGTFYTAIGGIKAVMWTDVVQVTVMVGALLTLSIKGTMDVGGLAALYEKNVEGKRLEPLSFSFDPTIRYTFWGCSLGHFVNWGVVYGTYQPQVQRYLSSPTMKAAQKAIWLNLPGMLLLYVLCCYTGLILYTRYWDCDPVSTKQLQAPDQIIPLFVMQSMSSYPGLPGLYVAGVFSGSLSTVSSVFNSLAAVVLEDFIRQTRRWKNITEEQAAKVSKGIALSFGLLCLLLASLGDYFGSVLQSSSYNINVFSASLFGIFALGLFFPWATSLGTEIGTVCGIALGMWFSIGTQLSNYVSPRPPISTHGCPYSMLNHSTVTESTIHQSVNSQDDILAFYKLSYVWMSGLIAGTVIISGLIASFLTGANDVNNVDPRLLSCSTIFFMKLIYGKKYQRGRDVKRTSSVSPGEDLVQQLYLFEVATNGTTGFYDTAKEKFVFATDENHSDVAENNVY